MPRYRDDRHLRVVEVWIVPARRLRITHRVKKAGVLNVRDLVSSKLEGIDPDAMQGLFIISPDFATHPEPAPWDAHHHRFDSFDPGRRGGCHIWPFNPIFHSQLREDCQKLASIVSPACSYHRWAQTDCPKSVCFWAVVRCSQVKAVRIRPWRKRPVSTRLDAFCCDPPSFTQAGPAYLLRFFVLPTPGWAPPGVPPLHSGGASTPDSPSDCCLPATWDVSKVR